MDRSTDTASRSSPTPPRGLLREPSDRRSLAFVGLYYLLLVAGFSMPWSIRRAAPLVFLLSAVSWLCAVIAHNALHAPLFRARGLNRVFQLALSCAYGFPVSEFLPGHNLSHHRHTQRPADLMRTSKAPFVRLNALNLLWFFPRVALDIPIQNHRYARSGLAQRSGWSRQLLFEIAAVWGSKAILLALDWRRGLAFVVLPHLWALYGITTVNYLQHDGCDEEHPLNHSRNFIGRAFNWLTFNNGFHGAHHQMPALHWSKLAAAHAADFHGRVHPALEQRSLAGYLLRTFVFSPRRARYDGPVISQVICAPDQAWFDSSPASSRRLAPASQEL